MLFKNRFEDYTEQEFLELAKKIYNADFANEEIRDEAVWAFVRLSEHPAGTDIIFYPPDGQEDTPEGLVKTIKEWRAKNGKPGFKQI